MVLLTMATFWKVYTRYGLFCISRLFSLLDCPAPLFTVASFLLFSLLSHSFTYSLLLFNRWRQANSVLTVMPNEAGQARSASHPHSQAQAQSQSSRRHGALSTVTDAAAAADLVVQHRTMLADPVLDPNSHV